MFQKYVCRSLNQNNIVNPNYKKEFGGFHHLEPMTSWKDSFKLDRCLQIRSTDEINTECSWPLSPLVGAALKTDMIPWRMFGKTLENQSGNTVCRLIYKCMLSSSTASITDWKSVYLSIQHWHHLHLPISFWSNPQISSHLLFVLVLWQCFINNKVTYNLWK